MKQIIALFVKSILSKFSLTIYKMPSGKPIWAEDEFFCSLVKQTKNFTLVNQRRCFMLYQLAKHATGINGDVAEIGVYKGGTAKLISKTVAKNNKTVHLFDTFSGMPETDTTKDLHKEGDFSDASLDSVKSYLNDCSNVCFYEGLFPDTAAPVSDLQFCFVHIDVDIYKSVMDCCKFFYPRMVSGGIMIFDDYGFKTCPGAKKAVDEFFSDKPEFPCRLSTGQCFVAKH